MASRKKAQDYAVGYGKPPVHTRFRKGQSGNPAGRPPKAPLERIKRLALKEAYRAVTVKDGDATVTMPAIQALLRSLIAGDGKGSVLAQRAALATIVAIEAEQMITAATRAAELGRRAPPMDDLEAARRICFLLDIPERERQEREWREEQEKARAALEAAQADPAAYFGYAAVSAPASGSGEPDGKGRP